MPRSRKHRHHPNKPEPEPYVTPDMIDALNSLIAKQDEADKYVKPSGDEQYHAIEAVIQRLQEGREKYEIQRIEFPRGFDSTEVLNRIYAMFPHKADWTEECTAGFDYTITTLTRWINEKEALRINVITEMKADVFQNTWDGVAVTVAKVMHSDCEDQVLCQRCNKNIH